MMNNGNSFYAMPTQPRMIARQVQPLTEDQIKELRNGLNKINFNVTARDNLITKCTHKEKDGRSAITTTDVNGDTICHCNICGQSWKTFIGTEKDIEDAVQTVISIFQSIKLAYADAPEDLIVNFSLIMPILQQLPKLYTLTQENLNKYDSNYNTNPGFGYTMPGYANNFNTLAMLMNPAAAMYPNNNMNPNDMNNGMMYPNNNMNPNGMPNGMMNPNAMNGGMMYPNNNMNSNGMMNPNGNMFNGMYPNNNGMMNPNAMNNANNPIAYTNIQQPQQAAAAPGFIPPVANNNEAAVQQPDSNNNEVKQQKVFNV